MKRLVLLVLFCLSFAMPTAFADSGSIDGAKSGNVRLSANSQVSMKDEKITVHIMDDRGYLYANVRVDYTLQNLTEASVTVNVGFPEVPSFGGSLQNFRATIDGNALPVVVEKGTLDEEDALWHSYPLTFAPGQERHLVNTYTNPLPGGEGSRGYHQEFTYILQTGASWAGDIGKADVEIHLGRENIYNMYGIAPRTQNWRYDRRANTLTTTFTGLEPTEDHNIHLWFGVGSSPQFACNWKISSGEQEDNPYTAIASSALPYENHTYSPSEDPADDSTYWQAFFPCAAFDGWGNTAWVSAEAWDPAKLFQLTSQFLMLGQMESVTFDLSYPPLDTFHQDLGFTDVREFSRPKTVRLDFYRGASEVSKEKSRKVYSTIVTLPKEDTVFTVPLEKRVKGFFDLLEDVGYNPINHYINAVDVTVLDVYPGERPNVAIPEVRFNILPWGVE